MNSAEQINKDYYNQLYQKRSPLIQLIYPFISYDQQCKSKYNIHFITEELRKNKKQFQFLDYGFGHGSFILKMPSKTDLYGCDISQEAVYNFPRVAKMIGKEVKTFLPKDLDNATTNLQFDMISLSHVIEHVDNDEELLRSLIPKLKPGGKFLINVPINEVWEDPKHVRKYTLGYMELLAEKLGLKIERSEEAERWSAYFLDTEMVKKASRPVVIFQRAMRLLLALMPTKLLAYSEKVLPSKFKHQQLLVLLSKK
jgi:SAM-dependent methyltransferase